MKIQMPNVYWYNVTIGPVFFHQAQQAVVPLAQRRSLRLLINNYRILVAWLYASDIQIATISASTITPSAKKHHGE